MGKLQELTNYVTELFNNATDKTQIDNLSKLKNLTEEVSKEQDEIVKEKAELIKDYKSLVQSTSFSGQKPNEQIESESAPQFEDVLKQFIKKEGK